MTSENDEVLYGYDGIGRFLGMTARQVEHRVRPAKPRVRNPNDPTPPEPLIPTFKIGQKVAARPAALREWLKELERRAAAARDQPRG